MSVHAHAPLHYVTADGNIINFNQHNSMMDALPNGIQSQSASMVTPILITRRLNVRITGSLSDFAQVIFSKFFSFIE